MFNKNYCVLSCVGHVYQVYINIISSDNRSQANISFREETTTTSQQTIVKESTIPDYIYTDCAVMTLLIGGVILPLL